MFETLIVPLDGSPLAERAIPYVDDLARRHRARVVLVRSIGPPVFGVEDPILAREAHRRESVIQQADVPVLVIRPGEAGPR